MWGISVGSGNCIILRNGFQFMSIYCVLHRMLATWCLQSKLRVIVLGSRQKEFGVLIVIQLLATMHLELVSLDLDGTKIINSMNCIL